MRLTAFMLCACALLCGSAAVAQRVTFSGTRVALQDVLTEVQKQTGYLVMSNSQLVKEAAPVTISAKQEPLNEFLDKLFAGPKLEYSIENKTITIRRKRALTPAVADTTRVPQKDIVGTVTDEAGLPIPGVTIRILGRSGGTSTDAKGQFRIKADSTAMLSLTSIGYQARDLSAASVTRLVAIKLAPSANNLDAVSVVSTGYQDRRRSNMVGSVSSVTGKDIENAGITTVDKALAGRMPGVYVRSVSGRPGETGQIIIRGVNTLTGSAEPLYVLDGMPLQPGEVSGSMNSLITNGIGNIPPENIETITILKDATAASIYGSRAANGVIVITTKNGKAGNDYVNYSGKYGITERPRNTFNFMNAKEKVAFERGIRDDFYPPYESGGRVIQLLSLADKGAISYADAEARIAELENTNTDWIKELYRVAQSQSHNISLSGGNTKTTYYAGFNYQDQQGSLIENRFQTGGLNMKLSRFATDKLLFKLNLYTTLKKNVEGQAVASTSSMSIDPFEYAVFANPYEKAYNADGSYAWDMTYRPIPYDIGNFSTMYYSTFNMIRELKENRLTNIYGNIRGQFAVEYDIIKGLKYTGNVAASYTSVHDKDESFGGTYRSYVNNWLNTASMNSGAVLPEYNRGFLRESTGRTFDYTVRNTLDYSHTFGGKHFVQAFFANEFGGVKNDQFNHFNPIYLQEYAIAGYPSWDLVADTRFMQLSLEKFGGTVNRENRSASFIGSLAYSYDNRYVFNGNVRYDGVDIIGSDNQFSPLWSAGVRWNAHNEKFLAEHGSIISRLVLSAGYGYRGSINRRVLPFHTYTLGTFVYASTPVASGFSYGNPVIKWEKKAETNLGMELSLFNGRINTEWRYFREKVIDLLDDTKIPPSVGRPSTTVNVGSLSNKGMEVSVRVEVIKNKDWLWEVGGNVARVANNLDDVFEKTMPTLANLYTSNIQGYPVNSWYGYKFSHINPENGSMIVLAQKINNTMVDGKIQSTYTDAEVDLSRTSVADMTTLYRPYFLGQRDPKFYGGFNTRLTWKSIELTSNFVFAGGNQIMSFQDRREGPNNIGTSDLAASRINRLKNNLNRWRQAGDITDIPLYRTTASSYTRYLISTDVESGRYLKCNELALSWRAPRTLLSRSALKTAKATLVAGNLFALSPYSGTDAETQTPFGYPNTRTYTLSLTLGF
ncbi:SusC/RagA family TonB-linked outer membrane protein [Chitinophaga horti]|uniref:SusC/RagA family TonB-linked outer membrane protein n=1 Tax=Chitinophaga horti TaxID=2920382 RepID=A0ABY6JA05_9BACT|nr:SusC/RagA family TonB-linked outer membrane protein [Chitinophaga horti]UYQ95392.1 SusC/RagA family TonB-linked outer membrane protein [Chitinophaga horti]